MADSAMEPMWYIISVLCHNHTLIASKIRANAFDFGMIFVKSIGYQKSQIFDIFLPVDFYNTGLSNAFALHPKYSRNR